MTNTDARIERKQLQEAIDFLKETGSYSLEAQEHKAIEQKQEQAWRQLK